MSKPFKEGFYWVKVNKDSRWMVIEYVPGLGWDVSHSDETFVEAVWNIGQYLGTEPSPIARILNDFKYN